MPRRHRRRSSTPAPKAKAPKREAFIGFSCPGQRYEGRARHSPRTLLTAFGGGIGYGGGGEFAEGEPEEMEGKMVACSRPTPPRCPPTTLPLPRGSGAGGLWGAAPSP